MFRARTSQESAVGGGGNWGGAFTEPFKMSTPSHPTHGHRGADAEEPFAVVVAPSPGEAAAPPPSNKRSFDDGPQETAGNGERPNGDVQAVAGTEDKRSLSAPVRIAGLSRMPHEPPGLTKRFRSFLTAGGCAPFCF